MRFISHAKHKEAMEKIITINLHIVSYLQEISAEIWAKYSFNQDMKADHKTNNMMQT